MSYTILSHLAHHYNSITHQSFTPESIIYKIRQIHLADGCHHKCLHCFANAPGVLKSQMKMDDFSRLAQEVGSSLSKQEKDIDFLYFGASTDPSMVKGFAEYMEVWLNQTPLWHQVKTFTHGWFLDKEEQRIELEKFISLVKRREDRFYKLALSFDEFSFLARKNWLQYLSHVAQNILEFKNAFPIDKLRLEVMYPLESLKLNYPQGYFSYWIKEIENTGGVEKFKEFCLQTSSNEYPSLKILNGLLFLIENQVLSIKELCLIYREAGVPFPGGRGERFFREQPYAYVEQSIENQINHSLTSIKDKDTIGLSIMPHGEVNLIDLVCYKKIQQINEGYSCFEGKY